MNVENMLREQKDRFAYDRLKRTENGRLFHYGVTFFNGTYSLLYSAATI